MGLTALNSNGAGGWGEYWGLAGCWGLEVMYLPQGGMLGAPQSGQPLKRHLGLVSVIYSPSPRRVFRGGRECQG